MQRVGNEVMAALNEQYPGDAIRNAAAINFGDTATAGLGVFLPSNWPGNATPQEKARAAMRHYLGVGGLGTSKAPPIPGSPAALGRPY
jgi:hypothetical protein